jgi:transketolase N-terminal domain/subunit
MELQAEIFIQGHSPLATTMQIAELEHKSIQYRRTILSSIAQAGAGHTGGSLSCTDILNVLYNQVMRVDPHNPTWAERDRYIHSKGHSVEALYAVLADRGFFPAEKLATMGRGGSHWVGHPTRKVPGVEQNTGALGHGLSVAVGMALAAKQDGQDYRVFTLMGDGELTEGSIWEASMSAAFYQLDNLVVIIDRNTLADHGAHRKRHGAGAAGRTLHRVWLRRAHGERQRCRGVGRCFCADALRTGQAKPDHRTHDKGQGRQLY